MGRSQYDQAGGQFSSFHGLYNRNFTSTSACLLAEDKQGLLWDAGFLDGTIMRIDPETGEARVLTERDGVAPGMVCGDAPVTLPEGQIRMAGTGAGPHISIASWKV